MKLNTAQIKLICPESHTSPPCMACANNASRAAFELASRVARRCAHKKCLAQGKFQLRRGWACLRHLMLEVLTQILQGVLFCLAGVALAVASLAGADKVPGSLRAIFLGTSCLFVLAGVRSGLRVRRVVASYETTQVGE